MPIHRQLLILVCFTMLFGFSAEAQSDEKEKLRMAIQTKPEDSIKVFTYYSYGELFELDAPDSADFYYQKGLALAKKLNSIKGQLSYASYAIVLLNNKGKYLEALELTKEAASLAEQFGYKRDLTITYVNIANEWQYLGDIQAAADYYLKAAGLSAEMGEKRFERVSLNNLASVFIELKENEKVISYARQALLIARELKDDYAIASCLINLGVGKTNKGDYDSAILDFQQVYDIGVKDDDYILMLDGLNGLADVNTARKDLKQGAKYYRQALVLAREKEAAGYEMMAQAGLSYVYRDLNLPDSAIQAVQSAIALGKGMGAGLELKSYYLHASELYESQGDLAQALSFRKQYEVLNDSLLGEKSKTSVQLAEAKYQTEKKEQQLQLQHAQIRQKNTVNAIFIGSTVALLLILFLIWRTYAQRRRLQEQKIDQLEKEKLLFATQSLLKGQEAERNRLAKDLHDGLGGLLSGVKLQLGAMKGNLILSEEMGRSFNLALVKLDESINEMRRVAHNMMPEALLKLGLQQALQDYCEGLSASQEFTINGEFHGLEKRMDASTEIVVYRIVQELLNNAVKHAGASRILAQVMRHDANLTITVEDNGQGFDPARVKTGAGMANIRSRVDYLKGQIDIQSTPGKGTSVHIDCIIEDHG
ncbi:MAG: hypothetical protein B7Z54_00640 [Sphingobacteriales bacterium 12-47-4]|nr:MAG: hypothetical protein B7Z54_00640 [Sphingobacteriales bacterium 12-47-4]